MNPLLTDFFSRLDLMERRGSGMRKIIDAYKQYEHLTEYHAPEFRSNATEFHVVLWNLNYRAERDEFVKEGKEQVTCDAENFTNEVVGGDKNFTDDDKNFTNDDTERTKNFTNEFVKESKKFTKAQRQIYQFISLNPKITLVQMSEKMGISKRQVQTYLNRLREMKRIAREGNNKNGSWKIIDEDYEGFFDRV